LAGFISTELAAQPMAAATNLRTLISPFSPGSSSDVLARKLGGAVATRSNGVISVENHPGASGLLAVQQLLKLPRNGEAVLLANSGLVCNTPLLVKSPKGNNPQLDLVPVCIVAGAPFFLFANRQFSSGTLAELQSSHKDAAAGLTYAANDPGSANHVAGEVILRRLSIRGIHVPYKNSIQGVIDVVEGRVQVGVFGWQNISSFVKAGSLKVLALLANERLKVAPDIATVRGQGFGDFRIKGWHGLFAAREIPETSLQALDRLMHAVLRDYEMKQFIADIGFAPDYRGLADATEFVSAEIQKYRDLFQELKIP
jgi:tripartite-type tricarboxylate transporter receptor subunit TctC